MTGNNTPVFFIRDPLKFGDFIHTQKRDPQTNLKSPTMMWDFWSLSPESLHQVTILFSGSRDSGRLPAHERLQQPHSQPDQSEERALLRKVALQNQTRNQEFLPRASRRVLRERIRTTRNAISSTPSRKATSRSGACACRSCRKRMRKTYHINPFDLTKVWAAQGLPAA